MNQEDILCGLHRLQTLVEGWREGSVPAVERDLALEELRRIYEAVRFADAEPAEEVAEPLVEKVIVEPAVEAQEPAVVQVEEAKETPAEEVTETPQEDAEEVAEEPVQEVVETPQEVAEVEAPQEEAETQQSAVEVEAPQEERAAQPDEREIFLPRQANRRAIMSLYGDAPQQQQQQQAVAPEPQPSAAPAQPQQQPTVAQTDEGRVLGDVINADDKRLCDTISRPKDIAAATPVASLRQAIGINDRFLLIRDLFGGDEAEYECAIAAIDACANLDDCMVYIVEHYAWHSDSEGARLIMDLIERRFGK